jgi:hypothetical protein
MAYPEKRQGKRTSLNFKEVSGTHLSFARQIVAYPEASGVY